MKTHEMSEKLRNKIGMESSELSGEELAALIDFEIERCNLIHAPTGKSVPHDRCYPVIILTVEAMKRLGEDYKTYLNNRGFFEIEKGNWFNDTTKIGIGIE